MRKFLYNNGAWVGFLLLSLCIALIFYFGEGGNFYSARNLTNLLKQTTINGILATGMTFVIITGGIDLSVGSVVALAGIFVGLTQSNLQWLSLAGTVSALGLSISVGLLCGLVNGGLVAFLGIPPFIITLGMMVMVRGIALIISNGSAISPMGEWVEWFGGGYLSESVSVGLLVLAMAALIYLSKKSWANAILPLIVMSGLSLSFILYKGIPVPVVFLAASLAAGGVVLNRTVFGRCVYATGSNEVAAFWAGVPVKKIKWMVYSIMGLFSGLAGFLLTGRLSSASPTAGNLFELDAIASVVIGGTSLKGGAGSVLGTLAGALTISVLNNGMDLLNVTSFYQNVLKGIIIVAAVSLDKRQRQGG